mgnify:FL=1|jgi:hypothetical protein
MIKPMLLVVSSILFVLSLALLIFSLWEKLPAIQFGSLALGDITNLLTAVLTMVGLAVAFVSLYVAIAAYQKSVKDSEEQQKSLDASRQQLQAVVDAATQQQEILTRNLETSKVQQELLSKSLATSKVQQEIQTKNLETSKAQLGLLEAQRKQEEERQSRKPIAEVAIQTKAGPSPLEAIEKQPPLDFPLEHNKKWGRVIFLVSNKGNIEIGRPLVRIVAIPNKVFVDHADFRFGERDGHNEYQFSGPNVVDIAPIDIAGGPFKYAVDITVPDSLDAFDLTFSIQGNNLKRKTHTLHIKVIRPSS